MSITVSSVNNNGGTVTAVVDVRVPEINAHARIDMRFPTNSKLGPADWREVAYLQALMMLDPA
jgi:hypothetical protein